MEIPTNKLLNQLAHEIAKKKIKAVSGEKKKGKVIFISLLTITLAVTASFILTESRDLIVKNDRQALHASYNDISPNPLARMT